MRVRQSTRNFARRSARRLPRPAAAAVRAHRKIPPRYGSTRFPAGHRPTGWCRPYRSALRAAGLSRPFHLRRHRGEDGVDIAAGLEAKDGAAVVEQVELDIAAAADQLLLAVSRRPWRIEIAPHQLGIDFQESAADVLGEDEIGLPVAAVMPVVEDAADAARLFPVRQIEIFVAPFPVFFVVRNAIVPGAG